MAGVRHLRLLRQIKRLFFALRNNGCMGGIDPKGHPIFLRSIKENEVLETFGRDSWKTVMQTTVDAVYSRLAEEMTHSPEIRKYADKRKNEIR